MAAAVFLHLASLLPVFVTERYRLAAVPGLLILGSLGLTDLWRNVCETLRTRSSAQLLSIGAFAVTALASAWFVSIPPKDPSLWALDLYNSGIKAISSDRLTLAKAKLEKAAAYTPNNPEVQLALGNLAIQNKEPAQAAAYYEEVLSLSPNHTSGLRNRAFLFIESSDWSAAKPLVEKALALEPGDAKTLYFAALIAFQTGNTANAEKQLQKAIALRPTQPEFLALQARLRELSPSP